MLAEAALSVDYTCFFFSWIHFYLLTLLTDSRLT